LCVTTIENKFLFLLICDKIKTIKIFEKKVIRTEGYLLVNCQSNELELGVVFIIGIDFLKNQIWNWIPNFIYVWNQNQDNSNLCFRTTTPDSSAIK
jgi:hypothetical protein